MPFKPALYNNVYVYLTQTWGGSNWYWVKLNESMTISPNDTEQNCQKGQCVLLKTGNNN